MVLNNWFGIFENDIWFGKCRWEFEDYTSEFVWHV